MTDLPTKKQQSTVWPMKFWQLKSAKQRGRGTTELWILYNKYTPSTQRFIGTVNNVNESDSTKKASCAIACSCHLIRYNNLSLYFYKGKMCCYWTHLLVDHWLEGCWRLSKDNSGCKKVCLHEHYKHACCDNTNCMLDAFKFDTIYKLPSLIPIQVFCCLQHRETGLCSFRYAIEIVRKPENEAANCLECTWTVDKHNILLNILLLNMHHKPPGFG